MGRKNDFKPKLDLVGKKFGKLTVESYAGYKFGNTGVVYHQWNCKCDCGNKKITTTNMLNSGHCRSCGCIPHVAHTISWRKHGKSHNNRLYDIWRSMKGRCYTPTNSAYKYYGARGIEVCEEWKNNFENFYQWAMKNGFDPDDKKRKTTLDRIDVNGNYEPNNCRLVDMMTQANNKTNTKRYLVNNEYLTLREIEEKYNIPYKQLKGRIDRGMSIDEAMYATPTKGKLLTFKGKTKTLTEWSKELGIKSGTIHARLNRGWSVEKALT